MPWPIWKLARNQPPWVLATKKKTFNCIGNEKCCDTSKHRLPTLDGLEPPRRLLPPCRLARTEWVDRCHEKNGQPGPKGLMLSQGALVFVGLLAPWGIYFGIWMVTKSFKSSPKFGGTSQGCFGGGGLPHISLTCGFYRFGAMGGLSLEMALARWL